ncbi:glycosyltransferase family 2 protein [Roseisolibacter agri]|uniref:Glycosyl transferase n=1 Tax=Roseisolibacter agri TaxID=2014610 RepID=A0AA37VGG2_9BACT|nr:glycosyltransferase [Roseisolibacter agri]GLC28484.1 glycosyl transferase [Roseisolibacter agri]
MVPVYNGRAFLADAIASIRNQTRPVDELLVVDDASTDGSAELAESLGACVIRAPRNGGPSAARNLALHATDCEVVAFLDADDWWLPQHCEQLAGALERHPEALLASARTQLWQDQRRPELPEPPVDTPFDAVAPLVQFNFVPQTGAVVRRRAVLDVGGYDERLRLSEDYDLWLRLALCGPFVHVPEVTVHRRHHEAQASRAITGMFSNMWQHRLGLMERLSADATRRDTVVDALITAARVDLRDAWHAGEPEAFDVVAAAAARVPGAEPIVGRWQRRRAVGWHAWHTLRRLRRALRAR